MAGETIVTLIGNLTSDPEMRYTQSGAAVANFTVASTARTFNRATGEWQESDTLFMRCSAWNDLAENICESLSKGMRVIVQGTLSQRSYETREGERRTVVEMRVDEVGPSLRYATANVTRSSRGGSQGGPRPMNNAVDAGRPQYDAPRGGQMDDPWATGGFGSDGDVPF